MNEAELRAAIMQIHELRESGIKRLVTQIAVTCTAYTSIKEGSPLLETVDAVIRGYLRDPYMLQLELDIKPATEHRIRVDASIQRYLQRVWNNRPRPTKGLLQATCLRSIQVLDEAFRLATSELGRERVALVNDGPELSSTRAYAERFAPHLLPHFPDN